MAITATAGETHTELLSGWPTGRADAMGYTVLALADGAPVQARRSNAEQAGAFREQPVGSGSYVLTLDATTLAGGTYELVVDDGGANARATQLQVNVAPAAPPAPTDTTVRPDAALVRALMPKVKWVKRGYAPPANPGDPDPLQFVVDMAADYVEETTGRKLDATMPPNLVRIAQMAVALATVAFLADFSDDQLEALGEGDVLASFSADGVSETYRDTGVSLKAQRESWMVHPWPPLNRLLWLLMTPEKKVWWVAYLEGGGIPMYGVAEVDWSGANRWGGVPGAPGDSGLAGDELARGVGGTAIYPTGSYGGLLGPDRPVG